MIASEEPMRQKLSANDQLDLLFEMELPLANVLAKMEIAGISIKKKRSKIWSEPMRLNWRP